MADSENKTLSVHVKIQVKNQCNESTVNKILVMEQ